MNRQLVKLSQLCEFVSGGTPRRNVERYFQGDIPWITSADLDGNVISRARDYITIEAINSSATNIVPKGNILLVSRTGVGKVAVTGTDICISQDFTGLIPDKSKVDLWYLFYFLRTQQDYFVANQRGATIKGITRKVIADLQVPLPPLAEQKRIAAILDRADRLRRLRRHALQLSEPYLQSVFIEMFGDPAENPKGWNTGAVREVADIIVPTRDKPKRFLGEIPWITLPDLNGLFVHSASNLLTHEDAAEVGCRLMPPQTVLLSCAGSVGEVAITTREVYTNQQFYGLVSKPSLIHPFYLAINLSMLGEEFYWALSGVSTIAFFSKAKALGIDIMRPPLDLQEKFARIVTRHERIRRQQREALRQANHLFDTLLHRAFTGQL